MHRTQLASILNLWTTLGQPQPPWRGRSNGVTKNYPKRGSSEGTRHRATKPAALSPQHKGNFPIKTTVSRQTLTLLLHLLKMPPAREKKR
uniref:Putative secreted protein n=1 Tax=Ixodes ricinus TaxID=34613 RepID=A0A6B0UGI6_IXORI